MKGKIVLGIGIVLLIIVGGWAYRYFTAPIEGRVGVQERIQSATNIIVSYNFFHDLYGAILSYDTSLKALEDELSQVTSEGEKERILATIAGLKGQRARAIQEYNANARKSYTTGQFRDWQLPYQIEVK